MSLLTKLLLLLGSCAALGVLRGFKGVLCAAFVGCFLLISTHLLNATTREDAREEEDEPEP